MTLNQPVQRPLKGANRSFASLSPLWRFGVGLGAVTLVALGVLTYLSDAPQHQEPVAVASHQPIIDTPESAPPQVWLSSLFNPGTVPPFARDDFTPDPVLPRRVAPLPLLPPRAEPVQPAPSVAAFDPTPQTAAPAVEHPDVNPSADHEPIEPALIALDSDTTHDAVTPDALALAALRAPTRSPLPRARPSLATAEPLPEAEEERFALATSPTPPRRPETVTRLASVILASATVPDNISVTPQPRTLLEVPPLSRAIARADRCESGLTRAIPRRTRRADGGSDVINRLASASGRSRDDAVLDEVLSGNIPEHLRDLVPVTFTGTGANGQETRITICVMPDYLAVGSDRDFVRVPLGLPAATRVAERFDMVLPTTRMVDEIYAQASVRLSPAPMQPGSQMASTGYFMRHNATVEGQRQQAGGRLGLLVSGHKKDLVLTNRLNRNPGRVAIYGWHRRSGSPIQPLSTVHGAQYADYSRGIRLVSRRAYVNGRAVDLRDLLSDSRLAGMVSSEGTITHRQMLAALR